MTKPKFSLTRQNSYLVTVLFLVWMVWSLAGPASAGVVNNPLQPIDTSSPRATLQGFLEIANKSFVERTDLFQSYMTSGRLYFSPEEKATLHDFMAHLETAERTLDLSELPPATVRESALRLVLQLKEILDRVELPPLESIPDEQAMAKAELKRWTIPGTEIRIARIEKGPRTGEYLFTAETIERIPEFYLKVKHLPYKPGASVDWYETAANSPTGVAVALLEIVPPRWILVAGQILRAMVLDQPLWRWLGIVIVLSLGYAVITVCYRLCRHWSKRGKSAKRWAHLLKPFSVVIVAPVMVSILAEVLRVTGIVYLATTMSLWTVFYLALTWLVWAAGSVVAETVIAHERLRESSIDSQLVRLALRLVTIVLAIAILITGADHIGLPAYSVLAGLGVGGLAVALAAQQTLANLLGSIIIMVEKPFAIGHWIKVMDTEGIVEDVGFRSTRIRTFYDSLVTIPSSQLVSATVDNMELRKYRQMKTFLGLTYDTPTEKIERFVEGVTHILRNNPNVRKDNIQVKLNELSPYSLDIFFNIFLKVPDRMAELRERQQIILDILRLAESMDVQFAFPTQTLHVESMPKVPS